MLLSGGWKNGEFVDKAGQLRSWLKRGNRNGAAVKQGGIAAGNGITNETYQEM